MRAVIINYDINFLAILAFPNIAVLYEILGDEREEIDDRAISFIIAAGLPVFFIRLHERTWRNRYLIKVCTHGGREVDIIRCGAKEVILTGLHIIAVKALFSFWQAVFAALIGIAHKVSRYTELRHDGRIIYKRSVLEDYAPIA